MNWVFAGQTNILGRRLASGLTSRATLAAFTPSSLGGLQAYYDFTDTTYLKSDSSNRVSYVSDVSGNSSVNALALTAGPSNYASSPDSSALDITGDIDIRANLSLQNWSPSGLQTIIGKWTGLNGNASYIFGITSSGNLTFYWTTNGSTPSTLTSSTGTGFSAYDTKWVRATFDVDNGSSQCEAKFYTSNDGSNWTQLGTTQTQAGVSSIFSGTAPVQIGNTEGSFFLGTAIVYRVQILNGINGSIVFDADFSKATRGATSFVESSSNAATVTIVSSGDVGARISGARDLAQLTGAKQPLLLSWSGENYLYFGGGNNNNASTPDSNVLDITGDIDIRLDLSLPTWSPSGLKCLMSKWFVPSNISFLFAINSGGILQFFWSTNGSSGLLLQSSVGVGFAANSRNWIRVTLKANNGSNQHEAKFYISSNGTSWTQLGTTQTGSGTTSIFSGSAQVTIGDDQTGQYSLGEAKIYRFQLYNGIDGTKVSDFNPSLAKNNDSSFVASTGETWTMNSAGTIPAQIVGEPTVLFDGSDDYMQSAPFALTQPETVVFVGKQNAWTSGNYISDGVSAADTLGLVQYSASPGLALYAGTYLGTNNNFVLKVNAIVNQIFNGANSSLSVNTGTPITGNAGTASPNGFTLGQKATGGLNSAIQPMQVLMYNKALTVAELGKLASWAAAKNNFII